MDEQEKDKTHRGTEDPDVSTEADEENQFIITRDDREFIEVDHVIRRIKNETTDETFAKICQSLDRQEDLDSDESEYGEFEQPAIRHQLKTILRQYPDGSQILRELIQNAEDASASDVKIIHDKRCFTTVGDTRQRRHWLTFFKTPAIFVYNDELFTKNDWKGIQRVYCSVKEEDVLKIGRFGLGFKSVFHMTDTPIIISGDRLLIINPLETKSYKVCHTIKLHNIYKKNKYTELRNIFNTVFGIDTDESPMFKIDMSTIIQGKFPGTLFWFPLRQSVPQDDPISTTIYTEEKVHDLCQSFHKEASMILLFLQRISSISMYTIDTNSVSTLDFSVNIRSLGGSGDLQDKRGEILKFLRKQPKSQAVKQSRKSYFTAEVHMTDRTLSEVNSWYISTSYLGSEDMSLEMRELLNKKELGYQPYVGVAFPANNSNFNPHVFCFLPLPLEAEGQSLTFLPVHVNGSFALDSNRRHMNWPTNDRTEDTDVSLAWNRVLITELIPIAYTNLIINMSQTVSNKVLFAALPDPSVVDPKWKVLLRPLYSSLLQNPIFRSKIHGRDVMIRFQDAVFSVVDPELQISDNKSETLFDIVEQFSSMFVRIPKESVHMRKLIYSDFMPCDPKVVTPSYLADLLRQDHTNVYRSFTKERKYILLNFISKERDTQMLENLELLPVDCVKSVKFKTFVSDTKETTFLVSKKQREILKGLKHVLVPDIQYEDILSTFEKMALQRKYGIIQMDDHKHLPKLLQMLLVKITEESPCGTYHILRQDMVSPNWIVLLWEYLSNTHTYFDQLQHLPILPCDNSLITLRTLCGNYVEKSANIPVSVLHILDALKICAVTVPTFLPRTIAEQYIKPSSFDGVLKVLEIHADKYTDEVTAEKINMCTAEDRREFRKFIERGMKFPRFLKYTRLFDITNNNSMETTELHSVDDIQYLEPILSEKIPVKFPLKLLVRSQESLFLLQQLDAVQMDEEDLSKKILYCMQEDHSEYNTMDIRKFMAFYLRTHVHKHWEECNALARNLPFIYNDSSELHKTDYFFDVEEQILQQLFHNEINRFPTEEYRSPELLSGLRILGLKTSKHVLVEDLIQVIKAINVEDDRNKLQTKTKAVIHFLKTNIRQLEGFKSEFLTLKWVPVMSTRPPTYSPILPWFGENCFVCTPENVVNGEHYNLVGSSAYVCNTEDLNEIFDAFSISTEPTLQVILKHWENIVNCPASETENLTSMQNSLFSYFEREVLYTMQINELVARKPKLWIGDRFVQPHCTYIQPITTMEEATFKPYRYALPNFLCEFTDVLERIGCIPQLSSKDLILIMREVETEYVNKVMNDKEFQVVINVLKGLVMLDTKTEQLTELVLPTVGRGTKFCPVRNCVHITDFGLLENSEILPDSLRIIDHRIEVKLANDLGVNTLIDYLVEYGYLKEITDTNEMCSGTPENAHKAVKSRNIDPFTLGEIVQCMEDKGSTTVKFLLDERMNSEHTSSLLDTCRAEYQGPSLMVYTDAEIKENDIHRLFLPHDGIQDSSFNIEIMSMFSKLPYILTKNTLTVLDIDRNILGISRVCSKRRVGVTVEFSNANKWLLQAFPCMFAVYEGLFGVTFPATFTPLQSFNGTIYRLPLHIDNLPIQINEDTGFYLSKILYLLKCLIENAGDMLIFTRYIRSMEILYSTHIKDVGLMINRLGSAISNTIHNTTTDQMEFFEKELHVEEFKQTCHNIEFLYRSAKLTWAISHVKGTSVDSCVSSAVAKEFKLNSKSNPLEHIIGFSEKAKLFNMSYLPYKTVFPVHINGKFCQDVQRRANANYIRDIITQGLNNTLPCAYIQLLQNLPEHFTSDEMSFYSLWPQYSHENWKDVVKRFYEEVIRTKSRIFLTDNEKQSLDHCILLDFRLRFSGSVGDACYKCFKELYESSKLTVIDIPKHIYESLNPVNIGQHIFGEDHFWSDIFFPSLLTSYWDTQTDKRNAIIAFALLETNRNPLLFNLMTEHACLPTKPFGTLARPCDIVHQVPGSPLVNLFDEKDGRYLLDLDLFTNSSTIHILCELGILQNTIPNLLLKERAESLLTLDPKSSLLRFKAILQYLLVLPSHKVKEALDILEDVAWIPILTEKPSDYPTFLPWFGEKERKYCKLKNGFLHKDRFYVGSVACVFINNEELTELVRDKTSIREEKVEEQFHVLINTYTESMYELNFEMLVDKLYSYFSQPEICERMSARLMQEKCVWTKRRFVLPELVCINFDFEMESEALEPYMYCLEKRPMDRNGMKFLELLGCHEELTIDILCDLLEKIKDEQNRSGMSPIPVSKDHAFRIVNSILNVLYRQGLTDEQRKRILLPVRDQYSWKLSAISKCVYCTDEMLVNNICDDDNDDEIGILDDRIGIKIAQSLGVQSLAKVLLHESNAEEMPVCSWGQSEPLTTKLNRLLEEYQDGFSVPKELVQNADDAKATEICFIYDERENDGFKTGLIDSGMIECQGPALWVFNNALFEEKDFQNIIKLAGKTKADDRSKIGKFGLGFCSVYNITDVPSFLSGNSMVILDPHTTHLGNAITDKSSPGIRITFTEKSLRKLRRLRNQFAPFNKICECDLSGERGLPNFDGTLFRFPLRTINQATDGKISQRPYSREDISRLLHQFTKGVGNLLIFTQNINTIKLQHIRPGESPSAVDIFVAHRAVSPIDADVKILNKVANASLNDLQIKSEKVSFKIEIDLKVSSEAEKLIGIPPTNSSSTWFLAWSSGKRESLQVSGEYPDEGAVPLGSVALPQHFYLNDDGGSVPLGFYGKSHIFCFLPLPAEINLPLHVNGCFLVDKSRRHLQQKYGTDTLLPNMESEWNDALLEDAVTESYLDLLERLPIEYYNDDNFTKFWPHSCEVHLQALVRGFYTTVIQSNHRVFIKHGEYYRMNECIFLHHSIRYDGNVGSIAFECFQHFHNTSSTPAMDIPKIIHAQFESFKCSDQIPELSVEDFLVNTFLHNIEDVYWNDKEMERNDLLMFTFNILKPESLSSLRDVKCVPTRPYGRLRRPCDIIEEKSQSTLVGMFNEDDERFIERNDKFHNAVFKKALIILGMMTDDIPNDLIRERAESIQYLSTDEQRKRLTALSNFLCTADESRCQTIAVDLADIPWIPTVQKAPPGYLLHMPWFNETCAFHTPNCIYHKKYHFLIGSVAMIYEDYISTIFTKLYKEKYPSLNLVLQQMKMLVHSVDNVDLEDRVFVERMAYDIYRYINQSSTELHSLDVITQFQDFPLVWVEKSFKNPRHIYLECTEEVLKNALEPYRFLLPEKYQPMKNIFEHFGCEKQLTFETLLDIQKEIHNKYLNLDTHSGDIQRDRRIVRTIACELVFLFKESGDEDLKRVLVPIATSNLHTLKMVPVSECTYTVDNFFLDNNDEKSSHINIMDRSIGIEFAEKLGIQSLTSKIMSDNDTEELGDICEWGQSEPLTTRIKGLIEEYDDGFAIPKELVQNADDAGASVIKFLIDERTNDDFKSGLIDEGMAECQGPALWVYNDALFTEDDFRNIIKLAGKTKESVRSQIGKFGLGFCAVYNITDVPSFVSSDSMVIFDPHTTHLNKAIKNKSSPGIRMKFTESNTWLLQKLRNQFMPFNGVFGCDLSGSSETVLNYEGTLFRFPLRTIKQAITGCISNKEYKLVNVYDLMTKFTKSIGSCMIFTQNVTTIEIYRIPEQGHPDSPELLVTVHREKTSGNGELGILRQLTSSNSTNMTKFNTDLHLEIQVTSTQAASRIGLNESSSSTKWYISNSTGGNETITKSIHLKDKGAVPLGSIAFSDYQALEMCSENELPLGFYGKQRLFCFLPLPQENGHLPVYMNGCFFVEKNRKSLRLTSGDDMMLEDEESEWNAILLKDAICEAYLMLVDGLPMSYFQGNCISVFNLWPLRSENAPMFNTMIDNFYSAITSPDRHLKLFWKEDRKYELSECIFLDFSLRFGKLGDIAFQSFCNFHQGKLKVMDLPKEVYDQFINTGCGTLLPVLSTEDYFMKVFMPNILSDYWINREEDRDALTLYAINYWKHCDTQMLKECIKSTECIPTRPNNRLRKPSDLIQENSGSLLLELFQESDERFVRNNFGTNECLQQLEFLGMIKHTIPNDLVLERAESVRFMGHRNEQIKRCRALLVYLKQQHQTLPENDVYEHLKQIPFLPLQEMPTEWPLLLWNKTKSRLHCITGDTLTLVVPGDLAMEKCMNIVGSVVPVMNETCVGKEFELILRKLGVKDSLDISVDVVLDHLREIALTDGTPEQNNTFLKSICTDTYEYLERHLEQYPNENLYEFKDHKIIFIGGLLKTPLQCIMELPPQSGCIEPELYEIDCDSRQLYRSFFTAVGVREISTVEGEMTVSKKDIMEIISKYDCQLEKSVDVDTAILIINLLKVLNAVIMELPQEEITKLLAPDSKNILRRPKDLCIEDDYDKLSDQENLNIIHDDMTQKLSKMLQIKAKRAQFLSQCSFGIPFGQHEDLTTRLRGILEDNPNELSVFSEMLQNADDAEATEICFVLDTRQHETKYVFNDSMKEIQGPALCVFNDSCFSQNDLIGLSQLGEGSKRYNASKTGQFGLGFNSVYNVTDVPSLLTKGPETPNGGTLVIFDPHKRYILDSTDPGIRVPNLDIVKNTYPDVYASHLQNDNLFQTEKGTWFRLPLRTLAMSRSSRIKNKYIPVTSIAKLFEDMKSQWENALLFLTNIRKISFIEIDERSQTREMFSIRSTVEEKAVSRLQTFVADVRRQIISLRSSEKASEMKKFHVEYDMEVEMGNTTSRWKIVQNFLSSSGVPEELEEAMAKQDIRLSPRGGVAYKYGSAASFCKESKLFCFLPLPMDSMTGLPVHVNGHFALQSSRASMWTDNSDSQETLQGKWNKYILQHVIPTSYVVLLESLRDHVSQLEDKRLQPFYNVFPIYNSCSKETCTELIRGVYQQLIDEEIPILPIRLGKITPTKNLTNIETKWVPIYKPNSLPTFFNAILDDLQRRNMRHSILGKISLSLEKIGAIKFQASKLTDILISIGMKLTDTPLNVQESIAKSNCLVDGKTFTPKIINELSTIQFLKTWNSDKDDKCLLDGVNVKVQDTVFKSVDHIRSIMEYCLHDHTSSAMIKGLPLLVDEMKILKEFSPENKIVVSQFSHLLPASREDFLHRSLVPCILRLLKKPETKGILNDLSLEVFASMLEVSIGNQFRDSSAIQLDNTGNDIVDMKWIKGFWEYLYSVDSEDKTSEIKQYLGRWCLLPSVCTRSENILLYSFNESYAVLDVYSFNDDRSLFSSLKKLKLPEPFKDMKTECRSILQNFLSCSWRPNSVLKCLVFHKSLLLQLDMRKDSALSILKYFASNYKTVENEAQYLKKIPLHVTVDGTVCSVSPGVVGIQLTSIADQMPRRGIQDITAGTNTIFLRENPSLFTLYHEILMFESKNETEFYIQHVLPFADLLQEEDLKVHMEYLKTKMSGPTMAHSDIVETKRVLENVPFIPTKNGRKKACMFYNSSEKLFSLMCSPDELLPSPFNATEWTNFMISAGMITVAPKQKIIQFAKDLEAINCISKDLIIKSQCIVRHIFQHLRPHVLPKDSFWSELSNIRFLVPYKAEKHLQDIYGQYEGDCLISFRDSILASQRIYGWSTCKILPKDADNYLYSDEMKSLGVATNLPLEKVLSHMHNVCYTLAREPYHQTNMMERFYDFLCDKVAISSSDLELIERMLSETPLIHIPVHNIFLSVDQVALKLPSKAEILPYLSTGPEKYGKFFDLFRKLGCTNDPTIRHFACVLKCIHKKTNGEYLFPEELKKVQKAQSFLFEAIESTPQIDENATAIPDLYLLSEDNRLYKSTELVYNNRPSFKKRLQNHPLNFLRPIEMTDLQLQLEKLPTRCRPKFLSDQVTEQIRDFIGCEPNENIKRLKNILMSQQFQEGVVFLLKNSKDKIYKAENLTSTEEEKIKVRLRLLTVQPVSEVKTVLYYGDKVIENSVRSKTYFWQRQNDHTTMYVKKSDLSHKMWIAMERVTQHIHKFITWCIGDRKFPEDLTKDLVTLDDHSEIIPIIQEYVASTIDVSKSWLPDIGSNVPIYFHHLLDNETSTDFDNGDIAVYEVCDLSVDEGDPNADAEYIYVLIVNIISTDSENGFFTLYKINDGEHHLEVYGYRLYKLVRPNRVHSAELVPYTDGHDEFAMTRKNEIFHEILKTLCRCWQSNRKDFKRVKKRLLLRWHPDKNMNQHELSTEVTQFILDVARRLEAGEHLFSENENKYCGGWRENYRPRDFANWWYGRDESVHHSAKQRRSRYERYQSNQGTYFSGQYGSHQAYFGTLYRTPPNPQPESARRWIKQAKFDLDSAKREMEQEQALISQETAARNEDNPAQIYNWICYKAHQASEKALKAIIMNNDMNELQNRKFTTHDLDTLAAASANPKLRVLSQQFRDLIQDHTHMRYPQNLTNGLVPSEKFTENHATKALEIAEEIIEVVDTLL